MENKAKADEVTTEDLFKSNSDDPHHLNPLLKLALELGPLVVFFVCNSRFDIFVATGAFMAAMTASLVITFMLTRKIAKMPLITGIVVLVFGTLTLVLNDELFIKIKPTITNTMFAVILFGGLVFRKPLLRPLMGEVLSLDVEGWKILTFRWACFFVFLALANEIMWRNFSTDAWVNFKVFAVMPLTMGFMMLQIPLIKRHYSEDPADKDAAAEDF